MVDCLRTVSVASLLSVTVPVPDYLSSFGPTLDAIVIPTEPRVAMTAAVIGRGSRAEEARIIATSSGGSNSSSHHRLHGHLSSSNSPSNPSASSSHLPPDYLLGVTRVECPPIFTPTEEAVGLTVARRDRILRTLVRNSFDFHQQVSPTLVSD